MIKLEYSLCLIVLSKCICDPMTQHVNCEYELPGQANKWTYRKYFLFPDWAGSSTICYAGMVLQNLVAV